MAGVKLNVATGSFITTTNAQTVVQIIAGSHHGVLIYRIQIDLNPNGIGSPAVAEFHVEKQTDSGSTTGAVTFHKLRNDPETLLTSGTYKATSEPTGTDVVSPTRLSTFGGTGITTVVFNFPRGLKVDGGERIGVVQVLSATPSPYPKVAVNIDLEE